MTGIAVAAGPPTTAFVQCRGVVVPLVTGLTDECRVTKPFSSSATRSASVSGISG